MRATDDNVVVQCLHQRGRLLWLRHLFAAAENPAASKLPYVPVLIVLVIRVMTQMTPGTTGSNEDGHVTHANGPGMWYLCLMKSHTKSARRHRPMQRSHRVVNDGHGRDNAGVRKPSKNLHQSKSQDRAGITNEYAALCQGRSGKESALRIGLGLGSVGVNGRCQRNPEPQPTRFMTRIHRRP